MCAPNVQTKDTPWTSTTECTHLRSADEADALDLYCVVCAPPARRWKKHPALLNCARLRRADNSLDLRNAVHAALAFRWSKQTPWTASRRNRLV